MSEIAIAENSAALLDAALDAAGGLERWREHSFLSAHLSQGGGLWAMKGQAGVLDDVRVDVALHQEWVSHHPFGAPELRSSFTPRRVELRDGDGTVVEALDDPRPLVRRDTHSTPRGRASSLPTSWEPRCGHTSPNRSASPFPASGLTSFQPWAEGGKSCRRLRVDWPEYLASHSSTQTLYFDDAGRLARHDYEVEIVAGSPGGPSVRRFRVRRRHHHAHPASHPCEGRSRPHRHQQRDRRDRHRRHRVQAAVTGAMDAAVERVRERRH